MRQPFKKSLWLGLLVTIGTCAGVSLRTLADAKHDSEQRTYEQLALFADVLTRVQEQYVEPVKTDILIGNALNGLLQSLDPHSRYVAPVAFENQQKRARREYGGLGIEVTMEDGLILVGYANPNAPAARSGIKAGDKITHVEGDDIKDKSLSDAVEKMRGLAGDPITITVKSPGEEAREVVVVREVIQGRAVRHRMYEGVGYVYLETFNNEHAARDLAEAIDLLIEEHGRGLPGLVLDLRGNGGGFLTQSINVAGLFLNGGEVVSVRGRQKDDDSRYHAKQDEKIPGIPLIVLINGSTASASEIVAGALQDRGRAMIIGTPSFGKGSVQSVFPLYGGRKGALRLTTARYFTPSGNSIQGLGITPDIWIEPFADDGKEHIAFTESSLPNSLDAIIRETEGHTAKPKPQQQFAPEDWPDDKDYQLEEAVKILKSSEYKARLDGFFNQ
ncbi:MAG: peptidase S41 [Robiginitomaculum sp.]|nr:MAG: peptidase S41 [Robiginitomaculum sp.]